MTNEETEMKEYASRGPRLSHAEIKRRNEQHTSTGWTSKSHKQGSTGMPSLRTLLADGVEGHDLVHHPRRLGQVTSLITSHHRLDVGLVVRFTGHRQRRRGLAENSEPRVSRLVYGTVLLRWNGSGSIDRLHQSRR